VASEREAAGLSRSLAYMAALKVARFGTANEHPDWEIGPSRLHLTPSPRTLKRIEGADRDGRFEAVPGILHAALALYLDAPHAEFLAMAAPSTSERN
jgi:hypothetical protein